MSYEDLLRRYQHLDRTRIFGPDWRVTQQWTSLQVPWSADYHQTRFQVNVTTKTDVVIVLSQLDETYFRGLQGQYIYKLQFRVQQVGDEDDYIVRSNVENYMIRSINTDITLEAGSYFVLMKITAIRVGGRHLDEIFSQYSERMRDKLIQVGLSYDIAHAKGVIIETEQEKKKRQEGELAQAAALKEKLKTEAKADRVKEWERDRKFRQAEKIRAQRRKRRAEQQAARRQLRTGDDGYDSDKEDLSSGIQSDSKPVEIEAAVASGVSSSSGALITSDERSEGSLTPAASGPGEAGNKSATDAIGSPLPSHDEPKGAISADSDSSILQNNPPTPTVKIDNVGAAKHVEPLEGPHTPLDSRMTPDPQFDEAKQHQRQANPPDESRYSDLDSASEFSWQTDLDFQSDVARDERRDERPYARSEAGRDWDSQEDPHPEPWNAVCVVGLRVYSKDPALSLEIVRPNPYSEEVKPEAASALDRDDPAKGAVGEKCPNTPLRGTLDSDREDWSLGG
jgi:hypothetical protein